MFSSVGYQHMRVNECADKLAKEALFKYIVPIPLGKGEGKAIVKRKSIEIWQKW